MGAPLKLDMVMEGRRLEMQYFKEMGVYSEVDRKDIVAMGEKAIATKWHDTKKGAVTKPNYRNSLMANENIRDRRMYLFAATPPLEVLKLLISQCVERQHG